MDQDIRWLQRFSNYQKALHQLQEAVALYYCRPLSSLEEQGVIHCFEHTHELAWKTLKDFLEYRGNTEIFGSKDVIREAFRLGLVKDGQTWMDMTRTRNQTLHIYDEKVAEEIVKLIVESYYPLYVTLRETLNAKKDMP